MLSSSFSRSAGSLFLLWLASPAAAQNYKLVENWEGENFLDYFKFYTGDDPTNGYVNYVDPATAEKDGLVKVNKGGSVYIGVDHKTTLDPHGKGRDSVRIGSKKYYDRSLVIADIAHMPGSVCGTWPAFWSVGREWPGDGEIDILEGVNLQDHNEVVMHTSGTCSLKDEGMSGAVNATGCGEALGPVGCVIEGEQGSYGTSFNRGGGGVYAMEWTEEHLKIWFFPRHSIPASISSGKPDVTKFGIPMALVQEGCDVANSFKPQSFVFDTTFCGDWAGGVFGKSGCPMTDADSFQSCHNFVAHNPEKFKESYWEINSVKIYQTGVKGIELPAPSHESATHEATSETTAQKSTSYESVAQESTVQQLTAQESTTQAATTSVATESPAEAHPSMIVNPMTGTTEARPAEPWAIHSSAPVGAFPGPSTEPAVEPPTTTISSQPKASTTRYVTQYVTSTSTVCTATDAAPTTVPHENTSAPGLADWWSSQSSPPVPAEHPATTEAGPSASLEPPTSWQSARPAEGVVAHQSQEIANSVPSQASSNVDAVNQAPKSKPSVEVAASDVVNYHIPATSSAVYSAAAVQPSPVSRKPVGSASHMPVVKPSKPVIPKLSGSATPSSSAFRGYPTGDSPVFTGTGNKLSPTFSVLISLFTFFLLA